MSERPRNTYDQISDTVWPAIQNLYHETYHTRIDESFNCSVNGQPVHCVLVHGLKSPRNYGILAKPYDTKKTEKFFRILIDEDAESATLRVLNISHDPDVNKRAAWLREQREQGRDLPSAEDHIEFEQIIETSDIGRRRLGRFLR